MADLTFNVGNTGICTKADGNYDVAQAAGSSDSTSNNTALAVNNTGSGSYTITRGFLYFDTSSIPNDAIILTATLALYATAKSGSNNVNIGASTSTNTTYANADYSKKGSVISTVAQSSINTSAYNNFSLSSPSTNVSKTGNTQLSVELAYQFGSNSSITFNGSNSGSNKPVLTVVTQEHGFFMFM